MAFECELLAKNVRRLSEQGVWLGTSSWKYPGWRGQIYTDDPYIWRGRFSKSRFESSCLAEYARVFKSVCVDAAYYQFPTREFLESICSLVPGDFLFAFKVTDEITLKRFTNLPRFGARAGQSNPNFLNADLFASKFLGPCEHVRRNMGLLIFEFSRFYPADFERGRDFVEVLDRFLGALPKGWRYGVEIRNEHFLKPEYFAVLARHGVAHIFNSWAGMPPVGEQLRLANAQTAPEFVGARFLLKPGRKYEEAVERFSPYDRVQEVSADSREAGARLIRETVASAGQKKAFIYVNNRLEGNAPETIVAMIDAAREAVSEPRNVVT
jgi:uncharacterized protein YecE (DUF72 family)